MSARAVGYPVLPDGGWRDVGGIRTWMAETGQGLPVVFVHGGTFGSGASASGAFVWDAAVAELSSQYRTIVYDRPAQGLTDAPPPGQFTMGTIVGHLIALIEQLELPPVHLVGHSRGGFVATRATLLRPDLVRSLTIVSSGTLSPGVGTNNVHLARPPFPPFTRESVRWVYERYCHAPESITDAWVDCSFQVIDRPEYRALVERMAADATVATEFLPALARDKAETLSWLREGRLQRPTQVIWGRDDRTAYLTRGYELYEMVSAHEARTVLNVIDKSGHFPYKEHARWFNATLSEFIATAGYEHA